MRIRLTQGQYTVIDEEDYEKVKDHKWYAMKHRDGGFKAVTTIDGKTVYMHRVIMGCPKGLVVDHIFHDTLDNRKSKLRICTNAQNTQNIRKNVKNTTGYKGVKYRKDRDAYIATITANGVRHYLGYFKDPLEAYAAYLSASIKYHGKYGCTK